MTLGFGPVVSFEVAGGEAVARRVVEAFEVIRHGPSLGGVETLATLPGRTSHAHFSAEELRRSGMGEGLIRLSIGIEDEADLWADLDRGLTHVPAAGS
jgi:cystathionine beta-lyase/cystathionine gamma-synthase